MGEAGNYIRSRRRDLGLTLDELAKRTGVSLQAISQIERGQTKSLRATTALALARALDTNIEDFLLLLEDTPPVEELART